MPDDSHQFSAKLPRFLGPVTSAPVAQLRDVAICVGDGTAASIDDAISHPPIASKIALSHGKDSDPVDLGRGVSIERLSSDDSDLVMNACTPRGHNFSPIRQFGQRYSFVRRADVGEWARDPYHWDPEGTLWDALALSRLVRDNGHSAQYAARIVDYEDGKQIVVYAALAEGTHVYRLREGRDWLDADEGRELSTLLATYWGCSADLPGRVKRAMWRAEYSCWLRWTDLAIPTIVGGLEALLKTERHGATHQFVVRAPLLATYLGIDGVTERLCRWLYDARSEWAHGLHVRLFAADPSADGGPSTRLEHEAFSGAALLQDLLRTAVRKAIEDPEFRAVFASTDSVRARWPIQRS